MLVTETREHLYTGGNFKNKKIPFAYRNLTLIEALTGSFWSSRHWENRQRNSILIEFHTVLNRKWQDFLKIEISICHFLLN